MKNEKPLKQDTDQRAGRPGAVFVIRLLMSEPCPMPDRETMLDLMTAHLGETECFAHSDQLAGFAPARYKMHFEQENRDVPPQLIVFPCTDISSPVMDEIAATQLWDCTDGDRILADCPYQVVAADMLAAGLGYKDRAAMLTEFIEALAEMFPSCRALVCENSKKMFTREEILNCAFPKEHRFLHYAVNVRFFRIERTDDMLIDTLGMSTLYLPDLQYHFHGLDPNAVVRHARSMLSYLYDQENPVEDGDRIDGLRDGSMSPDVQWKVRYEDSLIQPVREVIDIDTGEYASGER